MIEGGARRRASPPFRVTDFFVFFTTAMDQRAAWASCAEKPRGPRRRARAFRNFGGSLPTTCFFFSPRDLELPDDWGAGISLSRGCLTGMRPNEHILLPLDRRRPS